MAALVVTLCLGTAMADDRKTLANALRANMPVARLDPECEWLPSIDDAAVLALDRVPSTNSEMGGALFRNADGLYCYSLPVGNKDSHHIQFAVEPTKGIQLAAIYHTHPGKHGLRSDSSDRFSRDDIDMARKLKLASYIRVLKTGETRKFDPAEKRESSVQRSDIVAIK